MANSSVPPRRVACVRFLNAKPLIDGAEELRLDVSYDVPSRLLDLLLNKQADVALCPVIDYQRSDPPLVIVPVGCIASQGKTLTVRLFSRVPLDRISVIHADTDSHTSVALACVLLQRMHNLRPRVVDLPAAQVPALLQSPQPPETLLLIGDKVVTQRPDPACYPHDIDLGQAWHELTGLPFVFAIWMARQGEELGQLPFQLEALRIHNEQRIGDIVARYAQPLGWPEDLALPYLSQWLNYEFTTDHQKAMLRFWQWAAELELIPRDCHPLRLAQGQMNL